MKVEAHYEPWQEFISPPPRNKRKRKKLTNKSVELLYFFIHEVLYPPDILLQRRCQQDIRYLYKSIHSFIHSNSTRLQHGERYSGL